MQVHIPITEGLCAIRLYCGHPENYRLDKEKWMPNRDFYGWKLLAVLWIVGALGDRIDPRYLWSVFVGVFELGQWLAVQASTSMLMLAVSACLGMGFGGGVVCLSAVLSNYYGTKVFAALAGLAVAINITMSSITPSIAGWLYDRGHGYQGIFYTLAIWCFAGAVALFIIKPPVRKAASDPATN
jgi:MFS family permease